MTRLGVGLVFLAGSAGLGALAAAQLPLLWLLVAVGLWFAASMFVAAATAYPG